MLYAWVKVFGGLGVGEVILRSWGSGLGFEAGYMVLNGEECFR